MAAGEVYGAHPEGQVRLERDGDVAVLTIDRPAKLNSFTLQMVRAIDEHCAEVSADADIRCLVLTGAGDRAFSAGGDLGTLLPATLQAGTDVINRDPTRRFLSDVFKPVVAAIRGICMGGGLELVLGTDIRVAADDATFGLGEVTWGLIPGAGTHIRLPRQIPHAIAMHMILTGEPITAARAYAVGLINEVVAPSEVLSRAVSIAHRIGRNGPLAVQTSKEAVVRGLGLTDGFVIEHALNTRVIGSEDAAEGIQAFRDKRVPQFGRTASQNEDPQ